MTKSEARRVEVAWRMVLLIDNYDSFVHNLARYCRRLGQETLVVRNDATDAAAVRRLRPAAIILSPGPCTPQEAGCSLEVARELSGEVPIFGVCLGHQTLAMAAGARVVRSPKPQHGRTSAVHHHGQGIFAGVPSPFQACRYHSLVVEESTLPREYDVTARTAEGVVMALAHRTRPEVGVQFHPEAVLTEHGFTLLANFFRLAGLEVPGNADELGASELRQPMAAEASAPPIPVTF